MKKQQTTAQYGWISQIIGWKKLDVNECLLNDSIGININNLWY